MIKEGNKKKMISLPKQINKESVEKVLLLAMQIVSGEAKDEIDIARKCREIDQLRSRNDLDWQSEPFSIFFVMEDDIDDHGIPLREDIRQRWNQDALKKLDVELREIVKFYKKDILESCKAILNEYKDIEVKDK